jgi:uncharacterized membrane protein YbhN (UPF0104 family)
MSSRKSSTWREVLSILVPLVILFFLTRHVYQDWDAVSNYSWDIDYVLLIAASTLCVLSLFLGALGWVMILRQLGEDITLRQGLRIWFLSQMGKYLPGTIWLFVGRIYQCERGGISRSKVMLSILIEMVLFSMAAATLGIGPLFSWEHSPFPTKSGLFVYSIAVALGLILLEPHVLNWIVAGISRLLRRDAIELELAYGSVICLLFLYLLAWSVLGFAFFLMVRSIVSLRFHLVFAFMGIFAVSFLAGFLSFLTPGGLGVREGSMSFLLGFYMPLPLAILVSILSRVWLTLVEIICVVLSLALNRVPFSELKKAPVEDVYEYTNN